ncbi:hypothetical protein, partial [Desulfosoma sp.]
PSGFEAFSFVEMPPWGQNAPVAELDYEDASGRKFRLRCRADLSHVAPSGSSAWEASGHDEAEKPCASCSTTARAFGCATRDCPRAVSALF